MNYDGCFLFFGDARYDSRLQNLIRTLSGAFRRLALVQVASVEEEFEIESCRAFSAKADPNLRGARKFWTSYLAMLPKALRIEAEFYCAEDVFSLPVAAWLARLNRARLFYDSRELYFAIGALASKRFKQAVWSFAEELFISEATAFATGEIDSELLRARYRIPLPATIYNYPRWRVVERNASLRERLNLSADRAILLYQGMMGEGRGIFKMLDALEALPERFVLAMIGDGVLLEATRKEIKRRGLSERAFALGAIPHQALLDYTASADIGLALIEPISKSYELALPNKLFEYILCETPPVVSALPAMKPIVERYEVGVATALDAASVAEAILRLERALERYRANCRKAREIFNWDAQAEKVLSLFSKR